MTRKLFSQKFMIRIFIALLVTGLIEVLLLSIFSMVFSTRMFEESYRTQSEGRMQQLVNVLNTSVARSRETIARLEENDLLAQALFGEKRFDGQELSKLYSSLYKSLAGRIDDVSVHLVCADGSRSYSTHVLPSIYDPNSSEQSLSTYLKLKPEREEFPIVSSFVNPKGDQVALSLFHIIEDEEHMRSGYIIIDMNVSPLIESLESINSGFFSNIYLIDNRTYTFVSLYREGEWGNFDRLGWKIPSGSSGVFSAGERMISYASLYPNDLSLAAVIPTGIATKNLSSLFRMTISIAIFGLVFSSILAYAIARRISHPVTEMVSAMKRVEGGDLTVRIEEYRDDEFATLFHGFNQMSEELQNLLEMRIAREKALRTAQRKALQSQINPHFLYNTLNTVKAISKLKGVDEITLIITQLGKLLRDSIDSEEEFTTLGESLLLVEAYLQIQRIRYGSTFRWHIEIPEYLKTVRIPRLVIQPVVENSVVHGVAGLIGDKFIEVTVLDEPIRILIRDNGSGMDRATWDSALSGDMGVGLKNVQQRLSLYYRTIFLAEEIMQE